MVPSMCRHGGVCIRLHCGLDNTESKAEKYQCVQGPYKTGQKRNGDKTVLVLFQSCLSGR